MHEKRKNVANDEWHDGSTENVIVHLDENVETVTTLEMRKATVPRWH